MANPSSVRAIGQAVYLSCNVARANPSSELLYEWTFPYDAGISFNGSSFNISSIALGDYGNYSCSVTNEVGTGSANFTLQQGCRLCRQ